MLLALGQAFPVAPCAVQCAPVPTPPPVTEASSCCHQSEPLPAPSCHKKKGSSKSCDCAFDATSDALPAPTFALAPSSAWVTPAILVVGELVVPLSHAVSEQVFFGSDVDPPPGVFLDSRAARAPPVNQRNVL